MEFLKKVKRYVLGEARVPCSHACLQAASGPATEALLRVKHTARLLQHFHTRRRTVPS